MVNIQMKGINIPENTKYVLIFNYTQNYEIWVRENSSVLNDKINDILLSTDFLENNFDMYEAIDDSIVKYSLSDVIISNVDLKIEEETGKDRFNGKASREISFYLVLSIYDFDSLNEVLESNWGVSIRDEYDDEDEEASDVIQAVSNLFTGFYAEGSEDDFGIEFSHEKGGGDLITKAVIKSGSF